MVHVRERDMLERRRRVIEEERRRPTTKLADADLLAELDGTLVDPQHVEQRLIVAARRLLLAHDAHRLPQHTRQMIVACVELDELDQVGEEMLVVDCELLVEHFDVIVLDLVVRLEAEREVAWVVRALAHQVRALAHVLQQELGLLSRQAPVEPSYLDRQTHEHYTSLNHHINHHLRHG